MRWTRFRDTMAATEILSGRLIGAIAILLPPAEIMVGISVLAGWRLGISGPLLLSLLFSFLFFLAIYRIRGGKELVCGCFADFEHKTITSNLILRNILFIVTGLPLLQPKEQPLVNLGMQDWLLASTVIIGLILGWILMSRLVETVTLLRSEISITNNWSTQ